MTEKIFESYVGSVFFGLVHLFGGQEGKEKLKMNEAQLSRIKY